MPGPILYAQAEMPAGYCCRHPCAPDCRRLVDGGTACAPTCPPPQLGADPPAAIPLPSSCSQVAGVDLGFWAVLAAALMLAVLKTRVMRR